MKAWLIAATVMFAGAAEAGSKAVTFGPTPVWAGPPPIASRTPPPSGASVGVLYADTQARLGPEGDEFYSAYRVKVLSPEGLAVGNLTASWNPETDDFTVHHLRIIRDGRVEDVLARSKFEVVKQENDLEQAMLRGDVTAALQAPGLRVGDELEFAGTLRRRDPILKERGQGGMNLPTLSAPGAYRMRLLWSPERKVRWAASPDLGTLTAAAVGRDQAVAFELRDPTTAVTPDGAPERFNIRRQLTFTGFSDWGEVAGLFRPLYTEAARLKADSPLRAEAAKIAASAKTPAERAMAALRLTQDQVRYVYVGLNAGNYRPQPVDETWTRRFGDCKAKTALLLALLSELGIEAQPALVSLGGDDAVPGGLPMAGAFDHVVVRAVIDGRIYWLDGTRSGDRDLANLAPPIFQWALPLSEGSTALERVVAQAPTRALGATLFEIDAREGMDKPAKIRIERTMRGDAAFAFKTALSQLSSDDAARGLKTLLTHDWLEAEAAEWRYDEAQNLTVLSVTGTGEPEWETSSDGERWLDLYSGGFSKPAALRRPKEQDQSAPWAVDFPSYDRWVTIVRLPKPADGWVWGHDPSEMEVEIGGVLYVRREELRDNTFRLTISKRALAREISAEAAETSNKARADFDDSVPRVYLQRVVTGEQAEVMNKIAAEAGGDAKKLTAAGLALLQLERAAEGERFIDKALAVDPGYEAALLSKDAILSLKKDQAARLRWLASAAGRAGAPVSLKIRHGSALATAGRKEEALTIFKAVGDAHADDVDVVAELARALLAASETERAADVAEAGLRHAPGDSILNQVRAAAYGADERWTEALVHFDAALASAPEEPVMLRNRAIALRRLGRFEEALADLEEALRMAPGDEGTTEAKIRTLRVSGRKAEAAALFDASFPRRSTPDELNNRCWTFALADHQLTSAEADCAEAVRREPKAASFWDSYALVALRAGRLQDARRRYDQALQLNPQLAPSLYGRGLTRLRLGDAEGGRADIAAAESLQRDAGEELNEAGLLP